MREITDEIEAMLDSFPELGNGENTEGVTGAVYDDGGTPVLVVAFRVENLGASKSGKETHFTRCNRATIEGFEAFEGFEGFKLQAYLTATNASQREDAKLRREQAKAEREAEAAEVKAKLARLAELEEAERERQERNAERATDEEASESENAA